MNLLNKDSLVPEEPRTLGLPPAPGEARGPQIRSFLTFLVNFVGPFFSSAEYPSALAANGLAAR